MGGLSPTLKRLVVTAPFGMGRNGLYVNNHIGTIGTLWQMA